MSDIALKKKHPTLALWILLLVFISSWLVAYGLYTVRDKLNFKTLETGTLLSPPQLLQKMSFFDKAWLGKWQLIYVIPLNDNNASETLLMLKQIHTALGKEKGKVAYQVLTSPNSLLLSGMIGIVDPNGWLVMQYTPPFDPHGLLKDIRRLLRYSHAS